ncbi:hypothetical protein Leryth_023853, partial [Lithospermum erythrorhizon]
PDLIIKYSIRLHIFIVPKKLFNLSSFSQLSSQIEPVNPTYRIP